jgi:hypothetical protein
MSDETTSVFADIKEYAAKFWGWLDTPAQWFGAAVAYAPKVSLLAAVALALFALF